MNYGKRVFNLSRTIHPFKHFLGAKFVFFRHEGLGEHFTFFVLFTLLRKILQNSHLF